MAADSPPILIAAITGRALAASAARGDHRAVVLDCFADADTARRVSACRSVASAHGIRFDRRQLLRGSWEVAPLPGCGLVYGSGFEGRVGLLEELALERTLYGNAPVTVARARDPRHFFTLLDALRLPYPEVRFERPARSAGWLIKHGGSAGGTGVRAAAGHTARQDSYFQRQAPGSPMSVLFLANGERARIVGFNAQQIAPRPGVPFLYGGAVSRVPVPAAVEQAVRRAVDALVPALGLRGLNGLDFLLDADGWRILELNPRPTATVELYDADYPAGLFDWHLRSSGGELPVEPATGPSRASAIVHAAEGWVVPTGFTFPAWCADLPWPGTRFRAGEPICTVLAEALTSEGALALVAQRKLEMLRRSGGEAA